MSRYDRSEKLQTLVRLLSHREEQAKRRLAQRQQAVSGAQSKSEQLTELQREYRQRLEGSSESGVRASDLQLLRRFNQSLDEVVEVQSLQVDRLRQELEQAQSDCLAALVKRRGGERLEENRQRRENERARRRERVVASDRAAQRNREH
ncbi:MAG: flagellar export protein FliJ [Pseudomonadales bacterium]